MQIRLGRIVLAALLTEVLTIVVLVVIVALFGPHDPAAAKAYAERLGYWVGPISGFVLCLLAGYWVARGARGAGVLNGLVLGCVVAGIDVGLLVLGGAKFELIFAISNVGRVLAGVTGGWLAERQPHPSDR